MRDELGLYLDMFGTDISQMDKVIAAAVSGGATYADLYFENTEYRELTLRDGIVSSGGIHVDYGVGIRALDGEKCGYSYCESTDFGDMLRAAKAAAGIAMCGGGSAGKSVGGAEKCGLGGRNEGFGEGFGSSRPDFYPVEKPWKEAGSTMIIAALESLEKKLRSRDARIEKVIAKISSADTWVLMYNSLAQPVYDFRPLGSISASIVFSGAGKNDNRSASRSFRTGAELISEETLDSIVEDLVKGIDASLEAGRPKGGKMPVVMGAGASGILLHEAMGHAFEADFNRKGQSVFSDRMGMQVCPKGMNIVDDATWTGNRGACNFDDEGIPGQKTYMVTDGVLTSYLHDRISAAHYGVAPTGNGRREGFRFEPIPRMRLTYMENGSYAPQELIESVSSGIYVDEFSNGQVKIGEGDFTFYVKSGYLIENGRLTRPIKDVNVIGNGPEALADIRMVANDLKIDNGTWTCGKGQSVPVGCGMPSVKVGELTVGGE